MIKEISEDAPILTLYLNYPERPTETLSLRYKNGEYELLAQHNVTSLINGETIMLDELSITVQLEENHVTSIETVMKQHTYHQLADAVPTLQRLREISPIDTDHLAQIKSEDTSDPLGFLNAPFINKKDEMEPFPQAAYPGYNEAKFTSLNQYFAPSMLVQPFQSSRQEIARVRGEEGNILRDLGFA